jgi:hypothetical protein
VGRALTGAPPPTPPRQVAAIGIDFTAWDEKVALSAQPRPAPPPPPPGVCFIVCIAVLFISRVSVVAKAAKEAYLEIISSYKQSSFCALR